MKKYFYLFILVFLYATGMYSQILLKPRRQPLNKYIVVDSAQYVITYSFKFLTTPNQPKTMKKDVLTLQIGSKVSKNFSQLLYENDLHCEALSKEGITNYTVCNHLTSFEDIYKNYPKGKMTLSYRTIAGGPVMKYTENLSSIKFNWKIFPEEKEIHSIPCQKATTSFRGRNYTAWFAPSIPISDGPWKFNGLPGLILEINEEHGNFKYSCIGIQKLTQKSPIMFWKWNYQKTTRKKLEPFIKKMYLHPHDFLKITTGFGIAFGDGTNPRSLTNPFNPIELE